MVVSIESVGGYVKKIEGRGKIDLLSGSRLFHLRQSTFYGMCALHKVAALMLKSAVMNIQVGGGGGGEQLTCWNSVNSFHSTPRFPGTLSALKSAVSMNTWVRLAAFVKALRAPLRSPALSHD